MHYHNITKDDMLNGSGLRVVLWTSGCNHACKNCQNQITWNPNDGVLFDESAYNEIAKELNKNYISGLTLSGGDPMYTSNRNAITELCKKIKENFPTKNIWMYTGYSFEEIQNQPVLQYVDVLVDGMFIEELKDINFHWAGSTNQRIINVPETLRQHKIITLEE